MPGTHDDLSITSHVFIGMLAVGYEMLGLRTTLLLAFSVGGVVLAASLVAALLSHLRKARSEPAHSGGASRVSVR